MAGVFIMDVLPEDSAKVLENLCHENNRRKNKLL